VGTLRQESNELPTLADIALAIAAQGYPVFPCNADKVPITPNGFKDAVIYTDDIRLLFGSPNAVLIGVPTGSRSGIDALDLDYRHGAGEWEAANGYRIPYTRTHQTMSGGYHFLFRHADGVRNSASRVGPGVDVRGEGGYIIFAGSPGYSLTADYPIADWPAWLLELAIKVETPIARPEPIASAVQITESLERRYRAYIGRILDNVSRAPEGAKHDVLFRMARTIGGVMATAGLGEDHARELLLNALPSTVQNWKSAAKTATDGLRAGAKVPFQLEDRPIEGGVSVGEEMAAWDLDPLGTENDPFPGDLPSDSGLPPPTDPPGPEEPFPDNPDENKPHILLCAGLRHEAADLGMKAMRQAGVEVFQRDRELVRICAIKAKDHDGHDVFVPGIEAVTLPILARTLGQIAIWEKMDKKGNVHRVDPPREIAEQILSMVGDWPFDTLSGVTGTPTMRADYSILSDPGYDCQTGIYLLRPPAMPAIADHPTKKDAIQALSNLCDDLLSEFPFLGEESRSVALSMIMTTVLRPALGGAVPIHCLSAPESGTGKSYLSDIPSVIAFGEHCPVFSVASREEETEKRLTGAALSGSTIIALDNVNGDLSGDLLAQLASQPKLRLRPLGASNIVTVHNNFVVFVNGNNIVIVADLGRRTVRCSMDANIENPTSRTFTTKPVDMILSDRGKYIASVLTIARAYVASGMPNKPHRIPSYDRWSDLVCGSLVWLGMANPADTIETSQINDPRKAELGAILEAWPKEAPQLGHSTDDLIKYAQESDQDGFINTDFLDAMKQIGTNRTGNLDAHNVGRWLRRNCDRVIGNRKLVRTGTTTRPRWEVRSVSSL
jgi:putative DNA primase/helicase